jgi:hypothetical protein
MQDYSAGATRREELVAPFIAKKCNSLALLRFIWAFSGIRTRLAPALGASQQNFSTLKHLREISGKNRLHPVAPDLRRS